MGKASEYKLIADSFRKLAAGEREPLSREQFLNFANDYDFLAATDEKIESDKALLP